MQQTSNPIVTVPQLNDEPRAHRVKQWVAFTRELAEWCLRNAACSFEKDSIEEALKWNSLAARVFGLGCDALVSEELEENLLRIAKSLPLYEFVDRNRHAGPKRWLHLMDQALPYGGHTAMATRWIANDHGDNSHSVALLSQKTPVPESLVRAVDRSHGRIIQADTNVSMLSQANWLRRLSFQEADVVVLHIDIWNVIVPVAFGINGGPPVLLVNHAAHIFWVGGSVVDLVLNCRGSELENHWTAAFRGMPRCATLPIPLLDSQWRNPQMRIPSEQKAAAKRNLGLDDRAIVLLSIGAGFKYCPLGDLSFFDAAYSILTSCQQAHLFVVGPPENDDWRRLRARVGDRVQVVGRQFDMAQYLGAADVYLEGFPFGSTTAFLEAGILGIPGVLAPASTPPPFGTDGAALDNVLVRPRDLRDYVRRANFLIESPEERMRAGEELARSISKHHTPPGWNSYLEAIQEQLPSAHSISMPKPRTPPADLVQYWADFLSTWTYFIGRPKGDPLEYPFRLAIGEGLKPIMDGGLFRACRSAAQLRKSGGAPLLFYVLFGPILRVLPVNAGLFLYDLFLLILRANGRIRRSLRSLFRAANPFPRSPDDRGARQKAVFHANSASGSQL
jgi:glycosyltransferase involved in cell wall biosynthesis